MKPAKILFLALLIAAPAQAAMPESFWRAMHRVETGGRHGAILGDNGRSLGPYQITRAYHRDSGIAGNYEQVTDIAYARRVVEAYCKKYERAAFARGDVEVIARLHNSGPGWRMKRHLTDAYVARIRRAMR